MRRPLFWLSLLLAAACDRKAPATPVAEYHAPAPMRTDEPESLPTASAWGGAPETGRDHGPSPFEPIQVVTPSPAQSSEIPLPPGTTPIAVTGSSSAAEAALLLRDATGKTAVVSWVAGTDRLSTIGSLPEGFEGRSIARHPKTGGIFVAARSASGSKVFAFDATGPGTPPREVYRSPREINRLTFGPRPFSSGERFYRLFFAARAADGTTSLRSITEEGKLEYEVAGPISAKDSLPAEEYDYTPDPIRTTFAAPSSIHPSGEPMLWQDPKGCTHLVRFSYYEAWHNDHVLRGMPCAGILRFAPNGIGLFAWTGGAAGITVYADTTAPGVPQATADTFVTSPVFTPDGRGVMGVVGRGAGRQALAYAPIALPLADVMNAWQLAGNSCDRALFERNAGFLREVDPRWHPQLYSFYEHQTYDEEHAETPDLVTSDLFWENFGAAYNGVFILQERRRAIPAFQAFVGQTASALAHSAPNSVWARAFAAIAAAQRGDSTGEAGRILHGTGKAHSDVTGGDFDFGELVARGHYTSTPVMESYFREVHYLTQLSQQTEPVIDVAPLQQLPAEVRRSALTWIGSYRPFIAPARAPLLWDSDRSRTMAPFAKHPWNHAAAFPLSWGIDNEVLESTVFHEEWPEGEQIDGPGGRRIHPSGVDVAAMFGSPLGRTILGPDFTAYPRLRPVLDGITARRPKTDRSTDLYQLWLDAVAVEWADSAAFPGAPDAPVWAAKRLQTGLASWATLREATILVNERPDAAEAGEGGFESLVPEIPRGYVEPAPRTFEAIAGLYEALAENVSIPEDPDLEVGVKGRLANSAAELRAFAAMARKELRGEALTDDEYRAIRRVGGTAEHDFLLYKALADPQFAISVPEPMGRIADVAGDAKLGILEVAVGDPMLWYQIVPYFGRRQIAVGSVYSYYEFTASAPYTNEQWRGEIQQHPRPEWVRAVMAPAGNACRAASR